MIEVDEKWEKWVKDWQSNILISACQLKEVISRSSGLDKAQLEEVLETFDQLALHYIASRRE